jgi:hypothetical protein
VIRDCLRFADQGSTMNGSSVSWSWCSGDAAVAADRWPEGTGKGSPARARLI